MNSRILLLGAAVLLSTAFYGAPVYAQSEHEIIRMHEACRAGDRGACEHRDAVIHDHEHEHEWRRVHPEWYR